MPILNEPNSFHSISEHMSPYMVMKIWILLLIQDEQKLREALLFANGCGALTVQKKGAIPALPTKEAVNQLLQQTTAW